MRGVAARGMELVSTRPRPEGFFDPKNPAAWRCRVERPANATPPAHATDPAADRRPPAGTGGPQPVRTELCGACRARAALDFANSDLAFSGTHMVMGNFHGFNVYDIESARSPRLLASIVCPGGQGDVSIYGNLLFMSVEQTRGRIDCGTQGVPDTVSKERFRGVRIFDITRRHASRSRWRPCRRAAARTRTRWCRKIHRRCMSTARAPAACARARSSSTAPAAIRRRIRTRRSSAST